MQYEMSKAVLLKALGECEIWEETGEVLRPTYSGRHMYDRHCVGLVLDSQTGFGKVFRFLTLLVENGELEDIYEASEIAETMRTDSMGTSTIYYFPGLTCTDAEDGEDEIE